MDFKVGTSRYVLLLERCDDQSTLLCFLSSCFVVVTFSTFCFICNCLCQSPPSLKNVFVLNDTCGNNDYKTPQTLMFVRDRTLKGKSRALFAGHVSSTKVFGEILLSNRSAPTLPLWPLWWVLRAYMLLLCMQGQTLRVAEPDVTELAQALRLLCPLPLSVAQIQKTDHSELICWHTQQV